MIEEEQEAIVINEEEMIQFIYEQLKAEGEATSEYVVSRTLQLELDFLASKGVILFDEIYEEE
jgi:hypothetical protein